MSLTGSTLLYVSFFFFTKKYLIVFSNLIVHIIGHIKVGRQFLNDLVICNTKTQHFEQHLLFTTPIVS